MDTPYRGNALCFTYLCLRFRAYLHVVVLSLRSRAKGTLLTKESPGKYPKGSNFRCKYKISRLRKSPRKRPSSNHPPGKAGGGGGSVLITKTLCVYTSDRPVRENRGMRGEIEYGLSLTPGPRTRARRVHSQSPSPRDSLRGSPVRKTVRPDIR